MASDICPCCGRPIIGDVEDAAYRAGLSPSERILFLTIAQGKGRAVTTQTIATAIWGHDTNGGPDYADAMIRRYVFVGRQKLAPFGFGIANVRGVGYRLVTLKAEAA